MAWRYPPPGGFMGFANETPAQKAVFQRAGMGSGGGTRRRKKAKAAAPKRRKKSSKRRAAAPKKGSAAMKRKMARLRAKRKK